jgi:hypothetical protein
MIPWTLKTVDQLAEALPQILELLEASIDQYPDERRGQVKQYVDDARATSQAGLLGSPALQGIASHLLDIVKANMANGVQSSSSLELLYWIHELSRAGRADLRSPTPVMRAALDMAWENIIGSAIDQAELADSTDSDVESAIKAAESLVTSARAELTSDIKIRMHEYALRKLENKLAELEDDEDAQKRLLSNNIECVMGLTLPPRMRGTREEWRDRARHWAPSALKFAELEVQLPQPLDELLGNDAIAKLDSALVSGDATALSEALERVEQQLESNLQLRLDAEPDWALPASRVVLGRREPDAGWLEAKRYLDQNNPKALTAFMNLDRRKRNNPAAREWHAYALAKFGKKRQIHDIIALLEDVVSADNFVPLHHGMARWNLAIALNNVPARQEAALDTLLPMLEYEGCPSQALDLAMLWAMEGRRVDVMTAIFPRSRYFEAHLILTLWAARDALAHGSQSVDSMHLRRIGAILADPSDLPHPLERIGGGRQLDELVQRFISLVLVEAGITWFRQRLSSAEYSNWYKNWECLAKLYEEAEDSVNAWAARKQSVKHSLRRAKAKPKEALWSVKYALKWAQENGFKTQALRELSGWADQSAMPLIEVAKWQDRLGSTRIPEPPPEPPEQPQGDGGVVTPPITDPRETIDALAPMFDHVKAAHELAERREEATKLLDAAGGLSRAGSPEVGQAILQILVLVTEASAGVAEDRGKAIDRNLRDHGQVLQRNVDALPLEVKGLVAACIRVVQGFASHFRAVPDLTITMPHHMHMVVPCPLHNDGDVEMRLAARISNPADDPATDLLVTLSTTSEHFMLPTPELTMSDIPPQSKSIVDFPIVSDGSVTPGADSLDLRIHVAYRSVGVNRAVHARGEVVLDEPPASIPVTERFVTGAPVAHHRTDLFHGRDHELAELKEAFAGGRLRRLYFVNGIRRVGKSSLMAHLSRVLEPDVLALMLDFEVDRGLNDAQMVRQLLRRAIESLRSSSQFGELGIELPGAAEFEMDPPWTVFENSVRDLQRRTGRQILICLDEFQILVERIADPSEPLTDSLLSWMRRKAQDESDILLICTGSEKYDRVRNRYQDTGLWGNVQPYNISFVNRRAMEQIVSTPLRQDGVTWLPETLDLLWSLTEGHPWVTQILGSHAATILNRELRRVIVPSDIERSAELVLSDNSVSDLWWNVTDGLVTAVHRQIAFLILNGQASFGGGLDASELFQACRRAGLQQPGRYIQEMADLELLMEDSSGRWRIRGGLLERFLARELDRELTEDHAKRHYTPPAVASQSLGVFLDVENIKHSLLDVVEKAPRDRRASLELKLRGDRLAARLLEAASKHGKPEVRWAVGNWEAAYLHGDQREYRKATFQTDLAGEEKADASDHVLREHIHNAHRKQDLSAYVIATGDADFAEVVRNLVNDDKYVVLWATEKSRAEAFYTNVSTGGKFIIESLEEIVWGDDNPLRR